MVFMIFPRIIFDNVLLGGTTYVHKCVSNMYVGNIRSHARQKHNLSLF